MSTVYESPLAKVLFNQADHLAFIVKGQLRRLNPKPSSSGLPREKGSTPWITELSVVSEMSAALVSQVYL